LRNRVNFDGMAKMFSTLLPLGTTAPEFFLFDGHRRLVYRVQFDDSRPRGENALPVTGRDLRAALDAELSHQPVSPDQKPSLGCNIKWKPGNEPEY
jgi:hypothetical protein